MSVENLVNKALNRIGNVHPVIKKGAEEIIRRAYKEGIYVLFSDGYRSHAEQNKLYAKGRTAPGKIVTNARGGQSMHNFGLALDFFLTNKAGKTASWTVNANWRRVVEIAKSLGFEWGGDWKSFKDYPHIQMTGGLSLAQLRAGVKPNISLKTQTYTPPKTQTGSATVTKLKTNTKKETYPLPSGILRNGSRGNNVKQLQRALNAVYFKCGAVDGILGPKTVDAIRRFQMVYLPYEVDGVYGPNTHKKLQAVLKSKGY
ncbi:M15 family metallopeptidase [Pseudogracilibacillus auburnensis]|uniref:Peptidoglycan L-alanyl-D-glutamate endopeptidase CwlK n=1 Tax=Pseudogracilibacillus auburnensis TaxID=1494959 RepID=A0A2V3W6M3_9BACI|nr:M15 family metallopeptidase [Pseudogracilibacillus auburnensis]PXW88834.1 peptidoglycan L-alanyl-D-glutamate endopeptidase CwlK [Pseudogracilibacillus auburnensis]